MDQAAEPAYILDEVTTLGITPSTPQNDQAPVPNKYVTLVQILEKHRAAGVLQPLRTVVAVALTQRDRNAYKLAGATRWREYADMAVEDGIINLGGSATGTWVSLAPAWYDRAPQPSW